MANYTSWLDISSMSGGSGRTSLTLTASRNYDDVDKSAQIVAYNPVYNVSATTTVYIQRHSIYPIPYTADTSLIDFTGETRTITIDASDLVTSSITVTVYGATGVTTSYNGGVVTVVFPENFGNERDISIAITGVTTDNVEAEAVIDYRQAAFNPQESYLTFVVEDDGLIKWLGATNGDSAYVKTIEYKKNDGQWTSITSEWPAETISVVAGDVVKFRGDNDTYSHYIPGDPGAIYVNSFDGTDCKFSVVGNIMSLIDSTGFTGLTELESSYTFYDFFLRCSGLTSAEKLYLPATSLTEHCYGSMFYDCTSLTAAPVLPATTLADYCYWHMFADCSSLTTASELPATTLAQNCYGNMFSGCTSLVNAPVLPATTMVSQCYRNMFSDCTSLVNAPALPATVLAEQCYEFMFSGCTSLVNAPALPAGNLAVFCYLEMFKDCSSLVNAPALPARTISEACYMYMFSGCTSLTTAPALPSTTLATSCYTGMFQDCTGITTAPNLPATALTTGCYDSMFKGCSSLNYILCLATSTAATDCTTNWVSGVASSGTFVKHPDMNSWTIGVNGIPVNWVIEDADLPFTQHLAFIVESGGYIQWMTTNSNSRLTIQYKLNGGQWTNIRSNTGYSAPTISVETGDVVKFRGNNDVYEFNSFSGTSCQFSISGNIMSLINSTGYVGETELVSSSTFTGLFKGCTGLTSAENLSLPATTLSNYCYNNMFSGCTSLVAAPELPATTLANGCYAGMFLGCTSLTVPPELPATTLAISCYSAMFQGCTSLTTAPALSVATLADLCYQSMFAGCTSLTTAPALPATAMTESCYAGMFSGCTSLAIAPALPATSLALQCYASMFSGCTSLTTAPSLSATTLAASCYNGMFSGCTSLTTAPELPATTLAQQCYAGMFFGCSSLVNAPASIGTSATSMAASACSIMFALCTSLVTAPELPATTVAPNCYMDMFQGCTSLVNAPSILPATMLANYCYYEMFQGCTSLTTAPALPAPILTTMCYYRMFNSCASLIFILCLATDISANNCTYNWVYGVPVTGTFIKDTNMSGWDVSSSGIPPYNWTVKSGDELFLINDIMGLPESGSSDTVGIFSLYAWSVSSKPDWVTVSPSSGNIAGIMNITVTASESQTGVRNGTVEFSDGNNVAELEIIQNDKYVNPLTFNIISNGTIRWQRGYGVTAKTIEYMLNDGQWTSITSESGSDAPSITVVSGDVVRFRGKNENYTGNSFSTTCQFSLAGNIMSFRYGSDYLGKTVLGNYTFYNLFKGCTGLTSAENLSLPATTVGKECYEDMFSGCTSLTTAPSILPATTLGVRCYYEMFKGCTSLTAAPELPATTLASSCYGYMFNGCTNLNYIKCLATNLSASNCTTNWVNGVQTVSGTFIENHNMIGWSTGNNGIPTNWRVRTQYEYMPLTFKVIYDGSINWLHNRSLVGDVGDLTIQYRINGGTWASITSSTGGSSFNVQTDDIVEFQGNNATYGTLPLSYTSFSGSTAEFEAYGNVLSLISGTGFDTITALTQQYTFNRLFAGCTGLTNAEYLEIPAQTITMHCYSSMFQDCSNMTAGPTLPAPTLQNSCYNEMFNGCSSLANIKCLATDVSAYNCTYNWVSNVASSGTFVKASTMSGWGSGNSGIPSNWSSRNFTY